ncbi:peptidase MA family metallohydrolase [Myxococcus stipitatus]|uniref:peptidase MA family metallohydrolase n=1 Tax=Myxococcus stipitatus TaxID=83455 RepID=UPI0030D2618D
MRHLLVLLLLLLAMPRAWAQHLSEGSGPHPHGHEALMDDVVLVPHARPPLVTGEVTTRRFKILHTAAATVAAKELAAQIESVRDSFGLILGRDWPGVTEVRLGVGREEFEALALPGGRPPGWAVALAYPAHQIILLDALSLHAPDGQQTLRHELAHVALGQLARGWPRWFQEGVAQNVTGERFSLTHYSALFRAVTQERVFHFEDLSSAWPDLPADVEIAYAQSAAFVAHLSARYGPQAMGQLVDGVRAGEPFETSFGKAFHTSLDVEEAGWREGLAARYGWLPLTTSSALLWLTASVLCVAAYVRRRRQKEVRLAEMAAQEAADEAALRLMLVAQQQAAESASATPGAPAPSQEVEVYWQGAPSEPEQPEAAPHAESSSGEFAMGPEHDGEPAKMEGDGAKARAPKPTLH